MGWFKNLRSRINTAFRVYYENRISLKFGIAQFLGNVAFLQIGPDEYLELPPCEPGMGKITVTTTGIRPKLRYTYWPKGMAHKEKMPEVEVIVELRGFQVRNLDGSQTDDCEASEWDLVGIDDERVAPLKNLFLGFAFYLPLQESHKLKVSRG